VIRQSALPGRQPQPSLQAVQDALLALPSNTPLAAKQGFWRAYIEETDILSSRVSAMQSNLTAILRPRGYRTRRSASAYAQSAIPLTAQPPGKLLASAIGRSARICRTGI
jgi:hypothetical protein